MRAGKVSILSVLIAGTILIATSLHAKDTPLFESPVRIDLATGGNLLVSDYTAQKVVTLAPSTMKIIRSFDVIGFPLSVAWAEGKVLVGNETSKRIEAYNPAGRKLYDFSGAVPISPGDIAVDEAKGLVMVVDTLARDVKVFSLDGVYLYPLTRPSDLSTPTALVVDPLGERVYVSDYGSFSNSLFRRPKAFVRVFNYNGTLIRNISGSFVRPQGLALDKRGRLFVAESLEGRIEVFDVGTGKLLSKLSGGLSLPLDLAFDEERLALYASSNRSGRVVSFKVEGGVQ